MRATTNNVNRKKFFLCKPRCVAWQLHIYIVAALLLANGQRAIARRIFNGHHLRTTRREGSRDIVDLARTHVQPRLFPIEDATES